MKKKLLVSFLAAISFVCAAVGISACAAPHTPYVPSHTHSFTDYGYDDILHWSVCPDDGAIDATSYRYHDFSDGDCVCGKKNPAAEHVHTLSDEWSTNSGYHWLECSGCDELVNHGEHVTDNDRWVFEAGDETSHWHICKVCGEKFKEEEHSIQAGYGKDEFGHWTQCFNCDYKIGYEEHDFSEGDRCSCGYELQGTAGLEYELNAGGDAYILKSAVGTSDVNIVIPSFYNGKEVTEIAADAFNGCADVESIRIPETVNTIGDRAFAGCTSIKNINLPQSLKKISSTALTECVSLESISLSGGDENGYFAVVDGVLYTKSTSTGEINAVHSVPWLAKTINIPDGVTSVNFKNYTNLQTVIFGAESRMTALAANAFEGCTALTEVILPANLTQIGNSAFSKCGELVNVDLPEKLTSIGQMAFANCKKLSSICIPSSVTTIGNYAFMSCEGLAELTFGENIKITGIGNAVFASCKSLVSVEIPEGVKTLGQMAFQACSVLTNLTLPSSLVSIGDSAFQKCENLTSVSIPDNVTSIGSSTFIDCAMLGELIFGANSKLQTTGTSVFARCTALTSVTLPDTLTALSNGMFNGCTNLAEVNISENSNIATVGNMVFMNTAITSVVIPSLTVPAEDGKYSVGGSVFNGCENLVRIYYMGTAEDWAGQKFVPDAQGSDEAALKTDERLSFYVENQSDLPADGGSYWRFVDGRPTEW